ncbi:MAG: hypothetical protein SVY53_13040 [Chloroflexota bacterium]|nr:hypothetical protein [Chloroflexota bacterium]
MADKDVGFLKKSRASICHHCPACSYGRNKPESLMGKIMHNKLHTDHCALWKAEKEVYEQK